MMTEADKLATGVQGGFSVVAIAFLQNCVVAMMPWLITMFAVILCDLVFAIRKCKLMDEQIRISRAVRRTMGKCVTYFSFVLMVTMIEVAEGGSFRIDRWACLFVCAIELSSIASNILQPKGYDVDFGKMFTLLCKKLFNVNAEELKKDDNGKDKSDNQESADHSGSHLERSHQRGRGGISHETAVEKDSQEGHLYHR